jgi:5'(3')-deoxyribonucleotidase
MSKEVVAVDLDDVVVETAQNVIDYYNRTYGTNVTMESYYDPDYARVWSTSDTETAVRRVNSYMETEEYHSLLPVEEAVSTLRGLDEKYELHIVTGRPDFVEEATLRWIRQHFPDLYETVVFTNFFDVGGKKRHKGDICLELGASYLIDDHLEHAFSAAKNGINVLLFGSYPWNQTNSLPENVRRVVDWQEVGRILLNGG